MARTFTWIDFKIQQRLYCCIVILMTCFRDHVLMIPNIVVRKKSRTWWTDKSHHTVLLGRWLDSTRLSLRKTGQQWFEPWKEMYRHKNDKIPAMVLKCLRIIWPYQNRNSREWITERGWKAQMAVIMQLIIHAKRFLLF